ncbi:MAG: PQQ-binding-like beta-propeller repeat protein, partial [Candidatus Marinimicrobia bacterium]|nr:PQQ-binding-like beta-propeller repeat protein [Candidatus Neomarinimicrobiota bacterium]
AIKSSPSVDATNGVIYVGSSNGKLYAVNPNGIIQNS